MMNRDDGGRAAPPPTATLPADVNALLKRAIALHQQGRAGEAEPLYEAALHAQPNHPDALHLLGVARAQRNDNASAAELIGKALAANPANAAAHANRARVLVALGRPEEALAHYDRALALRPDNPEALNNRANVLAVLKRFDDAIVDYDRALMLKTDYADAHFNRGNVLKDLGRADEALAAYDRALAAAPRHVEALNNRANVLLALDRPDDALAAVERALALSPRDPRLHYNRGNALRAVDRPGDAVAAYDTALMIAPNDFDTLVNRGNALRELDRAADALASFDKAIALRSDVAEVWSNRGNALRSLDRAEEALASFEKALALKPDYLDGQAHRASALRELDRVEEAGKAYQAIVDRDPSYEFALGNLLETKIHVCDWSDYPALSERIRDAVAADVCAVRPLIFLSVSPSSAEQLKSARLYNRRQFTRPLPPLWTGERYRHDKIRVTYLSADLREHAVSYLLAGVLERHDRSRFEVAAVSLRPRGNDAMGNRIARAFDRFIDVSDKTDAEVAALLREMETDIAVDLMGYTGGSRTGILARRPAPVQVLYLGYSATMGAPFIDYMIADRTVVPPETAADYTEKMAYLPDCYMPTDSAREIAPTVPSRAEAGLPEDGFVFCSFNNPFKLNPRLFDVWMRLLTRVDRSVLWLPSVNADAARNLLAEAARRGVTPDRIVFAPRTRTTADHLARLQLADLSLDTLPYGGHTTTCDALWVGVPAVTCAGNAFATRVAASLLAAVGLPELVTTTLDGCEALALALATDPERLADIRARLRSNRSTTPLFNTDRYRRHLEEAYATMWERAERGELPESFAVRDRP